MTPELMTLGQSAAQEYYRLYYAAALKQKRLGTRSSTPRPWNALEKNEQQAMTEAFAAMMMAAPEAQEPNRL